MTASDLRKKRRLLQGQPTAQPASQGSRSTPADDQSVTTSAGGGSKAASVGDIGAGLSAGAYDGNAAAAPAQTPVQTFVSAAMSGSREEMRAAYSNVRTLPHNKETARDLKNAYFSLSDSDRSTLQKNIAANKDLFGADDYNNFQMLMNTPKAILDWKLGQSQPLNFESVGLTGTEAAGQIANIESKYDKGTSAKFAAIEEARGLPPGYLTGAYGIESNFGQNPGKSSAGALGPFQFIPSTATAYGLADRTDLDQSAEAAARLASDNKAALTRALGREPTGGELYLAHQQGVDGAIALLTHPDRPAAQSVNYQAIRQNLPAGMQGQAATMTGKQFASFWGNQWAAKAGQAPGAVVSDTGTPSAPSIGNLTRAGVLRKGSSGAAVTELQHFLNNEGATDAAGKPILADSDFGNRTREAVKAYQTKEGLTPDGVAGPQTIGSIIAKVNASQSEVGAGLSSGGVPETVAQIESQTPSVLDTSGNLRSDFAAGAAAAAIVVNPRLSAALGVSASATLNAAIDHPNEQFTSSNREWDPAAARIAGTFRKIEGDAAAQDAAYAKQKVDAMATPFAAPVEGSAGGPIPKTFEEWVGGGPGTGQGKEFVPPSERHDTSVWGDISRIWNDPVAELQKPTVNGGAGSGQFGSVTGAPTGGSSSPEQGSYYNGGGSGSSFDNFASGMSAAYQAVATGGGMADTGYSTSEASTSSFTPSTTTIPQTSGFPG